MNIATIGIDPAKNVFQLHGVDGRGKVVLRRQIHRGQMRGLFVPFARAHSWKPSAARPAKNSADVEGSGALMV